MQGEALELVVAVEVQLVTAELAPGLAVKVTWAPSGQYPVQSLPCGSGRLEVQLMAPF